MKVAIYGQETGFPLKEYMHTLLEKLAMRNAEIYIEEKFSKTLQDSHQVSLPVFNEFSDYTDLNPTFDLFFSFGGDGTMLSAVHYIRNLNIPMVGINTGRLGFLAGIHIDQMVTHIDEILDKKINLSPRSLLEISTQKKIDFCYALNEIALMRKETTSMITIDTHINDEYVNTFWSDGLIVSTPTGSTGYSLSCNGPIISPDTQNFVITPIAPHNLNVRPLIISDQSTIKLKVDSRVPTYSMSLDSRLYTLSTEEEILIKKAPFEVNIVQLKSTTYLDTLRKKLFWGSDRRN